MTEGNSVALEEREMTMWSNQSPGALELARDMVSLGYELGYRLKVRHIFTGSTRPLVEINGIRTEGYANIRYEYFCGRKSA